MLNSEMLEAIKGLMDQQKNEIVSETSKNIKDLKDEILSETSQNMKVLKDEIIRETSHNTKILLETEVNTKFNLLAEGQQAILEKLVPHSRVDDLEDEVKFLKSIVRQMNEDLQVLKKAQ